MLATVYKYKTLFASLLLAGLLVVPWGLSLVSSQLEPYPAVIMPSGASTVSLQADTLNYENKTVWARRPGGVWEQLSTHEFLSPVPNQYFSSLRARSFGLKNNTSKLFELRLLPDVTLKQNKISAQEVADTKRWLADKLAGLGYSSEAFEVRTEVLRMDRLTGRLLSSEVKARERYSLR